MSIVVALTFVAALLAALATNRDLFSPAKFFLFSFFVFHVGAFDDDHSPAVWLLILLVLLVVIAAVLFEAIRLPGVSRRDARPHQIQVATESNRCFLGLWILSAPAFLAQIFMINNFGGIEGYIASVALRVVEWRGLGWAKTLIGTIAVINLIYFAIGLTRPRTRWWWAGYATHFVLVLAMGAVSGSRSGILSVLAMQLFTYHYVKRRVRPRTALAIALTLVLCGLVLGVARERFKFDDGEITTGLADTDQVLSIPTLKYGVTPLDILVEAESLPLAYGSTLLSLITNAVPRDWWPDKPDTGGVFFTKNYTGDEWEGASNLTPTFQGEFVINFGWVLGIPLFLMVYVALIYAVVRLYRRTLAALRSGRDAASASQFVIYLLCMWMVVALMTGEVTNVLLTTALTGLIPAYAATAVAVRQRRERRLSRLPVAAGLPHRVVAP